MRATALLLLSAALLGAPAKAQTFSPDRIRADVAFLADDMLEGRATGTRGYDLAARYVAARFEALGLKPGTANGWFQQIDFATASQDPAEASSISFGGKTYVHGDHVLVSPTVLGEDVEGDAELVFVGYGIQDKGLGIDDYRGVDARGKIVVQLYGTPEGLPGDVAATLSEKKPAFAAAQGAIGSIAIITPALLERFPWPKILENSKLTRMTWLHPDGRPEIEYPTLRLNATVDPVAAEALFAGTPLGGGKLAALLADRKAKPAAFAMPGKVRIARHSQLAKVRSANVVGLLPGSDPKLANEVIVLSGHLDHIGIISAKDGDTIANGALDNAAGVATMIEVARAFTDTGARPKRSVLFVALTGEEKGLYGSEFIARYPTLAGMSVVGNVNLDMPILTYDFTDIVAFGAEHSTIGKAAAKAAAIAGVTLTPDPYPEEQLFVRSDHYSFVKQGVPAISLDLGPANGGKAAAEAFRTGHYHDVGDEAGEAINWGSAAKFARINYLIARELANAPERPLWYEGNFFGDKFAPKAAKAPKP